MLTRLKVNGFKNLVGVDVRFGPFTCIAGPNGAGKSNLFDAIQFLSATAADTLGAAAAGVRGGSGNPRAGDVRALFTDVRGKCHGVMEFEAEMLVPRNGIDSLGQSASASSTFLCYVLHLRLRESDGDELEVVREELSYIKAGDAKDSLSFWFRREWLDSVIYSKRKGKAFISTDTTGSDTIIQLHQDGNAGRPFQRLASKLPRTVLSAVDASEGPTVVMAKNEMISWRRLQLEPTALRQPDSFNSPKFLGEDGSHLPATVNRLIMRTPGGMVQANLRNQLLSLIEDVRSIELDRDEKRELLTLQVGYRNGSTYSAKSLSDGTLRFLALAVLAEDDEASGVLCLEEPENGIHPARIPSMLDLLAKHIAMDTGLPVGAGNPLRQVIVNTHSPAVVTYVGTDDILVAEKVPCKIGGITVDSVQFSPLLRSWREKLNPGSACSFITLLSYLGSASPQEIEKQPPEVQDRIRRRLRLLDHPEIQEHLNHQLELFGQVRDAS